jgi:hypothetical protein
VAHVLKADASRVFYESSPINFERKIYKSTALNVSGQSAVTTHRFAMVSACSACSPCAGYADRKIDLSGDGVRQWWRDIW